MEFKIGSFAMLENGERCEILSNLLPQIILDKATNQKLVVLGYEVLLADGRNRIAEPFCLRRIPRECDRVVSWQDSVWRPIPGLVARLERERGYAQRRISFDGKSA